MSDRPIILAEHNEDLRRIYTDMLEAAGFAVLAASDGEQAIALLKKTTQPQLIILDVLMPRLDGIETCQKMRELLAVRKMRGNRPCPIVFLSPLNDPGTLLDCLRAGGDDYLMKSASIAELRERIEYWCRKGYSEDAQKRRRMAIKKLESLTGTPIRDGAGEEGSSEQAVIVQIARYVLDQDLDQMKAKEQFYVFGYLVGMLKACFSEVDETDPRFRRLLRSLVAQTGLIKPEEAETLMYSYARIASQSSFASGWAHGQTEAANISPEEDGDLPAAPTDDAKDAEQNALSETQNQKAAS